jgi:mycothiol system anti-sigma-R factor
MSDCNETLRALEDFLDDELTPTSRGAIQAHLDGCLDCLSAFDFQAELRIVIRTKCQQDEMPAGLLERIERCFGLDDEGDPIGS